MDLRNLNNETKMHGIFHGVLIIRRNTGSILVFCHRTRTHLFASTVFSNLLQFFYWYQNVVKKSTNGFQTQEWNRNCDVTQVTFSLIQDNTLVVSPKGVDVIHMTYLIAEILSTFPETIREVIKSFVSIRYFSLFVSTVTLLTVFDCHRSL